MTNKRALITGITGQDGAYLAECLLAKGYEVFGFYRRTSSPNFWRLSCLGIREKVQLLSGDMTDMASITSALLKAVPDEIYNLAAQSFVETSFGQPLLTAAVDGVGVVMLLEAAKQIKPDAKIYHASTSELYGNHGLALEKDSLNEEHLFCPASPYAAAKLYSYHMARIYREAYGMFIVNGILFNHESPLRGLEFVTRKISNSLARIKLGLQKKLFLGNLEAERDWGYAPEYVEAMWRMLAQEKAEDYVVATGQKHSVRQFLTLACELLNLDPADVISQDPRHMRPVDVNRLVGDPAKARRVLGWEPKTQFKDLVQIMVQSDLERWQAHLRGEIFAWDAINESGTFS